MSDVPTILSLASRRNEENAASLPRTFRHEWKLADDDDWNEHLKYHNHLPAPLAEGDLVLSTGVVDPVGNERTNGVEQLPERHDFATDFGWCDFSNVNRTSGKGDTLTDSDQNSSEDEDTQSVVRCESLHKGGDDRDQTSYSHSSSPFENCQPLF